MQALLHLHIRTAISSLKLSKNEQNPQNIKQNFSQNTAKQYMQKGLFTLFALFPSRKDLERPKWKHKQEVWVCLSILELHKHSQSSKI